MYKLLWLRAVLDDSGAALACVCTGWHGTDTLACILLHRVAQAAEARKFSATQLLKRMSIGGVG